MDLHPANVQLEIHFYQKYESSLLFDLNVVALAGVLQTHPVKLSERDFNELLMFNLFTLRHLDNFGASEAIANKMVARLHWLKDETEVYVEDKPEWPRLTKYPGYPGKKRFLATLSYDASHTTFKMYPTGFGFLGWGLGYYAPASFFLLLKHLIVTHRHEEYYMECLFACARFLCAVFLGGSVTMANQTSVATSITIGCINNPSEYYEKST